MTSTCVKLLRAAPLLALLLVACSAGRPSVESRRKASVEVLEKHYASSTNPVLAKFAKDVLGSLQSPDHGSLEQPSIAFAVLVRDKDGSCRLHLTWIEENPSIDAIEVNYSDTTPSFVSTLSEEERSSHRADAKAMVHFSTGQQWSKDTQTAAAIARMANSHQLRVRLLRSSKPITNWFSIAVYSAEGWLPKS